MYLPNSDIQTILDYIEINNDFKHAQNILNSLSMCTCCSTHNNNKPKLLNKFIETPFNFNKCKSCQCPCRHFSRLICRIYNDSVYHNKKQKIIHNPSTPPTSSTPTSPPLLKNNNLFLLQM